MRISMAPHRLLLLAVLLFALGSALTGRTLNAQDDRPLVAEPIVATFQGGELTLTGSALGEPPSLRAVLFDYGSRSQSVTADSPLVGVWQDDLVRLTLPPDVQSGQLRVLVDGVPSDPVDLMVFGYEAFDIPVTPGTNDRPLAVAVAADGTTWINQEFHLELKSVSPGGAYRGIEIPQADGPGIFALTLMDVDQRSRISWIGAGITVDSAGDVWFTEGGARHYEGPHANTSRVIRYDPVADEFACFAVPIDNAQITGVLPDLSRGIVWYSETNVTDSTITVFRPDSSRSDCLYDPYKDEPPAQVCDTLELGCHRRYVLPHPGTYAAELVMDAHGDIWYTGFFSQAVGRLNTGTGDVLELPLPQTTARQGPGTIVGSGPWSLQFDSEGDLWISELFDGAILQVYPDMLASHDCERLEAEGQNPCIDEVFVGSDGLDRKFIEWLAVDSADLVWFAVTQFRTGDEPSAPARIGFVSQGHDDAVVFLPEREDLTWVTGIAAHPDHASISFANPAERKLGRLRLLGEAGPPDEPLAADRDSDGDGCSDVQELGPDPQLGGGRDPDSFWDFFDVPNMSNVRDGAVSLAPDAYSVILKLGAKDNNGAAIINRYSDPMSPPPADRSAYHPAFDRSPPPPGGDPWDSGPPDGAITLYDLLLVVFQYGHRC
ncbi:MAG: flexitail domain-containing putative surface protein [Dehalococcoidia bacterium]